MNQEALRQHTHYASVRQRLWPVVKEEKTASPREIEEERVRQEKIAKDLRIAAYRRSLAEDGEKADEERKRLAQERKAEKERVARDRAWAKMHPRWVAIQPCIDLKASDKKIVAAVLKHFPGLEYEKLIAGGHGHRVSAARAYIMYALFLKIGNQSEVARMMKRDHTTVNSAIRKVRREIGE